MECRRRLAWIVANSARSRYDARFGDPFQDVETPPLAPVSISERVIGITLLESEVKVRDLSHDVLVPLDTNARHDRQWR